MTILDKECDVGLTETVLYSISVSIKTTLGRLPKGRVRFTFRFRMSLGAVGGDGEASVWSQEREGTCEVRTVVESLRQEGEGVGLREQRTSRSPKSTSGGSTETTVSSRQSLHNPVKVKIFVVHNRRQGKGN